MKLSAIDFPCCLISIILTSPFSEISTFDYGCSSSLKTLLLNTIVQISDSHMQKAVMYLVASVIPLVILFYVFKEI